MRIKIAHHVSTIAESPTLAMDARAKAMKAAGRNIINLSAGEPDFDTPENVREAGIDAIQRGFTRYCPAAGIVELRSAVARELKNEKGLSYDAGCIAIANGAKQAIYLTLQSLLNPGDEVLIQVPYWVSYPEMVRSLGGKPVLVPAKSSESGFSLDVGGFAKRLSDRTKVIIINTPNNPTGCVYNRGELSALADVLFGAGGSKSGRNKRRRRFFPCVISDEVYEKLTYARLAQDIPAGAAAPAPHVSIATLSDIARENTVVVSGVSKTYAMTGWRIGYAAGPKLIVQTIVNLLGQSTSGSCSISQKAAVAALEGDQSLVEARRRTFDERRRYAVTRLRAMKGVECTEPLGAFYVFPSFKAILGRKHASSNVRSTEELARILLEKKEVATVPGEAFGAPGFLRLSYAAAMETIKAGLDRLEDLLGSLR